MLREARKRENGGWAFSKKRGTLLLSLLIVGLLLNMAVSSLLVSAAPPDKCDPWPECKDGGGGEEPPADPAIAYLLWKKNYGYKLMVMNADGSRQTTVYDPGGSLVSPNWSPDGKSITFTRQWELWRIDIEVINGVPQGSNLTMLWDDCVLCDPAWSPSGDVIAFVTGYSSRPPSTLFRIPANGGSPEELYTAPEGSSIMSLAWSQDASQIAFYERHAGEGFIKILDVASKGVTTVLGPVSDLLGALDWAGTQDVLVFHILYARSKKPIDIYTLDIASGETTRIAEGYNSPSFSPDDTQLVFNTVSGGEGVSGKHDVIVYDFATGQMERLAKGSEADWRSF